MNRELSVTGQISLVVGALASFCGVCAVVLGILAGQDQTIASRGKPTPQTIRAEDLAEKGPGDNVHVTLTDFDLGNDFVEEHKQGSVNWTKVYVPIYPKGQAEAGKPFKVAVKSSRISGPTDLAQLARQRDLTGIVINPIQGQSGELNEFRKAYPKADLMAVWLIDDGRPFPSPAMIDQKVLSCSILGGVAVTGIIGAVALGISDKRRQRAAW